MYDNKIGWGVDGYGQRHFFCEECGNNLGFSADVQPFLIKHKCGYGVSSNEKIDVKTDIKDRDELLHELLKSHHENNNNLPEVTRQP